MTYPTATLASSRRRPGRLFWVEMSMAVATAALAVLTLAWPDWVEATTGLSPDQHNGSFEWELTLILAAATLVLGALASLSCRAGERASASRSAARSGPYASLARIMSRCSST